MDTRSKLCIRVRACVVVIRDNRLLLFPHFQADKTFWYLPGGAVEFGETLQEAAARECLEETGIRVRCHQLIDVAETIEPDVPYHSITHVFLSDYQSGEIVAETHPVFGEKTARWCSVEELEMLECRPAKSIPAVIAILKENADLTT